MAPERSDNLNLQDNARQRLALCPARLRGQALTRLAVIAAFLLAVVPAPVAFADGQTSGSPAEIRRGPITNLPLPRYVSMKAGKGNARRGPSLTQRVDWVFKRANMPLRVTAEYGHWRRVEDWEGEGGWMHYSLLSGVRMVLVTQDLAGLHNAPKQDAPIVARAEAGVIAHLGSCTKDWCRIRMSGYRGWVQKSALWGVGADELRD